MKQVNRYYEVGTASIDHIPRTDLVRLGLLSQAPEMDQSIQRQHVQLLGYIWHRLCGSEQSAFCLCIGSRSTLSLVVHLQSNPILGRRSRSQESVAGQRALVSLPLLQWWQQTDSRRFVSSTREFHATPVHRLGPLIQDIWSNMNSSLHGKAFRKVKIYSAVSRTRTSLIRRVDYCHCSTIPQWVLPWPFSASTTRISHR